MEVDQSPWTLEDPDNGSMLATLILSCRGLTGILFVYPECLSERVHEMVETHYQVIVSYSRFCVADNFGALLAFEVHVEQNPGVLFVLLTLPGMDELVYRCMEEGVLPTGLVVCP